MNPALPDNAVMLPPDFERQQIFYWLKRVSSVTAWRRILEYYKAWAVATESSFLEPRYLGEPGLTQYGVWIQQQLPTMTFPDELPPVPEPLDNRFVRTNSITPCTGIWEPVDVPKRPFLSLITGADKPQPPFKIVGAMNYLHAGSQAPCITVETADDSIRLDTTWRLLWRDDRYKDGTVPPEGADYRFTSPDKVQAPPPPIWGEEDIVLGESGAAVPVGGKRLPEADINSSVMLNQGGILPLHQGREVRWILAHN